MFLLRKAEFPDLPVEKEPDYDDTGFFADFHEDSSVDETMAETPFMEGLSSDETQSDWGDSDSDIAEPLHKKRKLDIGLQEQVKMQQLEANLSAMEQKIDQYISEMQSEWAEKMYEKGDKMYLLFQKTDTRQKIS